MIAFSYHAYKKNLLLPLPQLVSLVSSLFKYLSGFAPLETRGKGPKQLAPADTLQACFVMASTTRPSAAHPYMNTVPCRHPCVAHKNHSVALVEEIRILPWPSFGWFLLMPQSLFLSSQPYQQCSHSSAFTASSPFSEPHCHKLSILVFQCYCPTSAKLNHPNVHSNHHCGLSNSHLGLFHSSCTYKVNALNIQGHFLLSQPYAPQ